jgi:hypothetical protein
VAEAVLSQNLERVQTVANRKQKLTQAIAESVDAAKLKEFQDKQAAEAAAASAEESAPKPQAPAAFSKRTSEGRKTQDRAGRRKELEAGQAEGIKIRDIDALTRKAHDLAALHQNHLSRIKSRPENMADPKWQNAEPMTLEQARAEVAKHPIDKPVTEIYLGK